MKKSFLIITVLLFSGLSELHAQKIATADLKKIEAKEDSMRIMISNVILDSFTAGRMRSDSLFIKTLVRTLQIKNSFYYPFDSLQGISKVYAPDSTFRIITWTLSYDQYYSRQRGAIQYNTKDGRLKLTPLIDNSEFTDKPEDSVRSNTSWIGATYYNIIKTQYNGKKFYTLFGFDNNNEMSSKKWIEVMTFNEKNEPVFGGPFFTYQKDSIKKATQYRYSTEFKKGARILVDYVPDMEMILVDHLISETEEPEKKWTNIPDGDYEGFKWENGKWVHVDKVFTFALKDGQAPVDDPLLDANGNRDEKKLEEQNKKNKTKKPGGGN